MVPMSIDFGCYSHAAASNSNDQDPAVLVPPASSMDAAELSALAEKEAFYMPQGDYLKRFQHNSIDALAREKAVNWIFKVRVHYSFRPETVVLSVNYLDRFLSRTSIQKGKAWMMQLASVACLSLAAKMEETEAPLLLDLQVEEAECIFEPRTIQRMELLLLGTLEWRMTSVTPLSYMDYGSRLLDLQNEVRSAFAMRTTEYVLCAIKEIGFMAFRPSVVAAAIMLHVGREMGLGGAIEYENRLLAAFKMSKDTLRDCYQLLQVVLSSARIRKPKDSNSEPGSPHGVLDASFSCSSEHTTSFPVHSPP